MHHHLPSPDAPSRLSFAGQARQIAPLMIPLLMGRRFLLLLAAVLIVASGLAGLDLAYRYAEVYDILLPPQFSLSEEQGLGERLEYALTASLALVMALRYWRHRIAACAFVALVFAWLTVENVLAIHEAAGRLIAPLFPRPAGSALHSADLGEFAFLCLSGAAIFAGLVVTLQRSRWSDLPTYLVLACVPAAAVFGVGVDLIHSTLLDSSVAISQGAAFVEDFGELLMLCLAWALAFGIPPIGRAAA
jgi:hypothetical protein